MGENTYPNNRRNDEPEIMAPVYAGPAIQGKGIPVMSGVYAGPAPNGLMGMYYNTQPVQAETVKAAQKGYCVCGAKITGTGKFCPECGALLPKEE